MAEATKVKKTAPKRAPKASKTASTDASSSMAVIKTGGKQYLVRVGQRLRIEKVLGDNKVGDNLVFKEVLMKDDAIGTPHVSGAKVEATITKIDRYKKVDVIKYKQKSRYFKKYGHRQPYFEVKIDSIN